MTVMDADTHFELGRSLQQAGDLTGAEAAYRRAVEHDPAHLRALNNLGIVLEAAERWDEAMHAYRQALAVDDSRAIIHYNLGHALHASGRADEAIAAYREAIRLDANDPDFHGNLAAALHHVGERERALESFEAAVKRGAMNPSIWRQWGYCHYELGRVREARAIFHRAAEMPEAGVRAFCDLGRACEVLRDWPEAERAYREAVQRQPSQSPAHEGLARAVCAQGDRARLVEVFDAWLKHLPMNPVAMHLRGAMLGENAPVNASSDYVRSVFDAFADEFDETLARLGYRGPQLLTDDLKRHRPEGRLDLLDAGCGTGLCGPRLRPLAAKLVGVDLSAKMLERARERGMYDELVEADLIEYLHRTPSAWDAVVAADTLCYFGDLSRVVAALAGALRPGGIVLFSVEAAAEAARDEIGFQLQPHGRYVHDERYVRSSLEQAGLRLMELRRETLRNEGGKPVEGLLVVAEPWRSA